MVNSRNRSKTLVMMLLLTHTIFLLSCGSIGYYNPDPGIAKGVASTGGKGSI
jgi:hypothetical protein